MRQSEEVGAKLDECNLLAMDQFAEKELRAAEAISRGASVGLDDSVTRKRIQDLTTLIVAIESTDTGQVKTENI